jgi:hypothetical protein
MPLAWDKSKPIFRSLWIAAAIIFFLVENRAINRNDYQQAQLVQKEECALQRILTQGQTNFESGLNQGQYDFQTEMQKFDAAQQAERQDFLNAQKQQQQGFSALLDKENALLTRQEQLAEGLSGKLFPASDPTPVGLCGGMLIPDDAVILMIDTNAYVVQKFPHPIFLSQSKGSILSLDRGADGALAIIMDLRSADGRIIVRLTDDGFVVNRNNYLEMKENDKSTLDIIDEYGRPILHVRYANPKLIEMTPPPGFMDAATGMVGVHFSGSCFRASGAVFNIP